MENFEWTQSDENAAWCSNPAQGSHRSEKPNNKLWASFTSPWK